MTFAKWMDCLDDSCESESDMVIYILPNDRFREAYRRGIAPKRFSQRELHRIRAALKGALASSGKTA